MAVESLMAKLKSVMEVEELPKDVVANLRGNAFNEKSFCFLQESDLKELGFVQMGPRKLVCQWMIEQKEKKSKASSNSTLDSEGYASSTSVQDPIAPHPSLALPALVSFRNFPIDDLLSRIPKGTVDGPALCAKLKGGKSYSRSERLFFVKTVAKYLMEKCLVKDKPSVTEKLDMAQSIVTTFPFLKDPQTGGCEEFYDSTSHTGHLEMYIRCKRSRSPGLTKPVSRVTSGSMRKRNILSVAIQPTTWADDDDAVRSLRERKPNPMNQTELLHLMELTRPARRSWIERDNPSITDVLRRFPRFQDLDDAMKEEFKACFPDAKSWSSEWPSLKGKVLQMAVEHETLRLFVEGLDDFNEDGRTLAALKCLIHFLPTPPKRGAKVPKLSLEALFQEVLVEYKHESVEEALDDMRRKNMLQPSLFTVSGRYFVKLDNTTIPLPSVGCLIEALEYLFRCFYVFSVDFPQNLRVFYSFLAFVTGLRPTLTPVMRDFIRLLDAVTVKEPKSVPVQKCTTV